MVDFVTAIFPEFKWVHDRRIVDGCYQRRPDLLLDLGTQIIIVEVDENKHSSYNSSCEGRRLMEISVDLEHRPIVLIRFNPDAYVDIHGTKVGSCWKMNKLGVMQVKSEPEWNARLEALKEQIQYWIKTPSDKTLLSVELFYG